ncbi:MAG: N,N-dimethylformamidase beta subunit family domain-containing protein, partial [Pirellula sp.]
MSLQPGEELELCLSSSEASTHVSIARLGVAPEKVWEKSDVAVGLHPIPDRASSHGCNWPVSLKIPVPNEWKSGYYQVTLTVGTEPKKKTNLFFVVR